MSDYLCPNCSSEYVVPDSREFHGEQVFRCMTCTSWFTESGEPVCFESDCGGDDMPDRARSDEDDFSGNPDLNEVSGGRQ